MSESEKHYTSRQSHTGRSHPHRSFHFRFGRMFRSNNSRPSAKQSFWKRLKTDKSLAKNLLFLAGAILLLTATVVIAELETKDDTASVDRTSDRVFRLTDDDTSVLFSAPFFDEDVYLANEATLACVAADPATPIDRVLKPYRNEDNSWPRMDTARPVELAFNLAGLPTSRSVVATTVEIVEEETARTRVFTLKGEAQSLQVPLLKTGTAYRYRINMELSDGSTTAVEGSFRTAETPRILTIDGIVNVRDIGGWKTADGKTVRQGLLYRGSELDGAVEPSFTITQSGVHDMLSVLGIRTDMDLRSSADSKYKTDALGVNVEHIYYGTPSYNDIFTAAGKEAIRRVFADLANENKYPVYLHCTYGRDRTGTLCYLLEALLGLSEEDLLREYRLSALYYGSLPPTSMDTFLETMATFAGETMQEKAENYLLSAGVTQWQLEQIRNILLA